MYIDAYRVCDIVEKYLCGEDVLKTEIAKELFLSILDVSFSRTGGCIAIIDEKYKQIVKANLIYRDDLDRIDPLEEKEDQKTFEKKEILRRLLCCGGTGKEPLFHNLDRKLRLELLSLDGATVIDSSGRILCIGAIVAVSGGSSAGGRTLAAKQLARYGLGIKVSMDGSVEGFCLRNDIQSSVEKASTNNIETSVQEAFTIL